MYILIFHGAITFEGSVDFMVYNDVYNDFPWKKHTPLISSIMVWDPL